MSTQSLGEAVEYILQGMHEENGVHCPCCEQKVKLYKRPLNSAMAVMLIVLSRINNGVEWTYIEKWRKLSGIKLNGGGDYGKLAYWGLIESQPVNPGVDKGSSGMWRITQKGKDFVSGKIEVPKHVLVYNNTPVTFSDKLVDIHHCLGVKFSYRELMKTTY